MDKHTYCVIMAGGIGSRFWPKSRQSKPKQFLDILGTGKSFIRMTYERFEKLAPAENFLVVTNARYKDLVLEQIPELGPEQVLCEPVGRNTAPCICYAAYGLQKRDPGAKMIVTPADHLILNEEDFRAIIGECLDFIDDRAALMTVGIKPTRPETGYGYIQVSDDRTISKVKCFTEKPNLELALPARPQGPLRQRQTREGMLYGRKYPQLHRLPPGRQSSRHQRPEGVHRGGYGGRAADLSAQRGTEHQEVHRRSEIQRRRQTYLRATTFPLRRGIPEPPGFPKR